MPSRSRRVQRRLEKYLFNPGMRLALRAGVAPRAFALLETTGRRTGLLRQTPVGGAVIGDCYWLVSEHGENCGYVKNLIAQPRVRVRIGRRWRPGTATVVPDDDGLARRTEIDRRHGRWAGSTA